VLSEERDTARLTPDHETIPFSRMSCDGLVERVAVVDESGRAFDTAEIFRQREKRGVRARMTSTIAQRVDHRLAAIGRGFPANVVAGPSDCSLELGIVHGLERNTARVLKVLD
jgi:hypothetical protein